jgi:hypothetical protein
MFENCINLKYFLLSFVIGIAMVYFWGQDIKTVVVYPNPLNVKEIQFKDNTENCFEFKYEKLECPEDESQIMTIPLQ